MADYKGIKGFKVQSLASDPTVNEGQIWYNTTSDTLKYDTIAAGTWSAGGDVNTSRTQCAGAGRSNSAALMMGGNVVGGSNYQLLTESYDGTTWTEVTAMGTARNYFNGIGTQTAALVGLSGTGPPFATQTNVETYNGTGWTEQANANTARAKAAGAGTTTSCIYAGGATGGSPGTMVGNTETYDGTSWTAVNALNTARWKLAGSTSGTPSATLVMAGSLAGPPWTNNAVEEWNGTSWAAETALGTARYGPGGCGISTNALCFGGYVSVLQTESWNGTAWTEVSDLATPSYAAGDAGSASASEALFIAGQSPAPNGVRTQEWLKAAAVKTVTTS